MPAWPVIRGVLRDVANKVAARGAVVCLS